jgi:hypothetical protein
MNKVAPGNGSPVFESVTFPESSVCEKPHIRQAIRKRNKNEVLEYMSGVDDIG